MAMSNVMIRPVILSSPENTPVGLAIFCEAGEITISSLGGGAAVPGGRNGRGWAGRGAPWGGNTPCWGGYPPCWGGYPPCWGGTPATPGGGGKAWRCTPGGGPGGSRPYGYCCDGGGPGGRRSAGG